MKDYWLRAGELMTSRSEPHKIVVKCWLSNSARFADVHWNPETSRVLNQCTKSPTDGAYQVSRTDFHDVLLRNEIK